ncbi:hypothetical protein [Amycolatopsis sp. VC5-11]|uniref:hypothetical protein n=1 Tax=Amycolatopsis sp. VC5-11 TaxID=3120156 RepID=UPI003008BE66
MTTPPSEGPRHHNFRGFNGVEVVGTRRDFVALDPEHGHEAFVEHFRRAGQEHARRLTRDLCDTTFKTGNISLDLDEAIANYRTYTEAHVAYTEGLCKGLAEHGDLLRGVIALRDSHIPDQVIIRGDPALANVHWMSDDQCREAADYLDNISGRLADRAGRVPSQNSPDRQQSLAQARADALARHPRQSAADGQSRRSDPQRTLAVRPGTAGGRHAAATEPQHRGRGRR